MYIYNIYIHISWRKKKEKKVPLDIALHPRLPWHFPVDLEIADQTGFVKGLTAECRREN